MRKLLLLLLMTLFAGLPAQNRIVFTYDDSGNRTSREMQTIILQKDHPDPAYSALPEIVLLFNYKIKVYPNPTFGQLSIEIEDFEVETPLDVVVYDRYNTLLQRHVMRESVISLDLSQYPSATWYIVAFMLNGERRDFKIIKL